MTGPTLEQIAEFNGERDAEIKALLARELIALREAHRRTVAMLDSTYTAGSECEAEFRQRLDAIEASASSGEQSAGDETKTPSVLVELAYEQTNARLRRFVERAEAERDEARRERDEARDALGYIEFHRDSLQRKLATQTALREGWQSQYAHQKQQLAASQSALEKYGKHDYGCALQQSDWNPCTCGLTDALQSTPANPEEASDA